MIFRDSEVYLFRHQLPQETPLFETHWPPGMIQKDNICLTQSRIFDDRGSFGCFTKR